MGLPPIGIVLGGWWSYQVLGWGGFWGWDPVENAALLPWLCGTAYLHSVDGPRAARPSRVWNLSLLIAAFSLTILGTFLTRSGCWCRCTPSRTRRLAPCCWVSSASSSPSVSGLIAAGGVTALRSARDDRRRRLEGGCVPRQQPPFRRVRTRRAPRHGLPALCRGGERPAGHRRAALLRHDDASDRLRTSLLHGGGAGAPVAQGGSGVLRRRLAVRHGSVSGVVVVCVLVGVRGLTPLVAFGLGGFAGASAVRQLVLAAAGSHHAGGRAWRALFGRANGGMIVHLGVVRRCRGLAPPALMGSGLNWC